MMLQGSPVTGMVRSVKEDRSLTPTRWIITVVTQHPIAA